MRIQVVTPEPLFNYIHQKQSISSDDLVDPPHWQSMHLERLLMFPVQIIFDIERVCFMMRDCLEIENATRVHFGKNLVQNEIL